MAWIQTQLLGKLLICIALLFIVIPLKGQAQEIGRVGNINATGVPYRVYAGMGEPTIQVYVVGSGGSGIYEIGESTRLDQLLALASIAPGATSPRVRRKVTIRLYHLDGAKRSLVLEERLEDLMAWNPDQYPELQDGDFMEVEVRTRERFNWRDGLSILGSVSTIIFLIDQIKRVF